MGANSFIEFHKSLKNIDDAFSDAVEESAYEHGHNTYTGQLASKASYIFISKVKTEKEAFELADQLIDECDDRIDDKWGPAGAIQVKEPAGFVFFGWAPS